MEKGYLILLLHAHLPYVRHPEYEQFLEEGWFFEALAETYIPIVNIFDKMLEDGVDCKATISLSPPLLAMMADPLLQDRFLRHMWKLIELSNKEVERTKKDHAFNKTARMYQARFNQARWVFEEKYGRNLINAFKKFWDARILELITCTATHGFLPLLQVSKEAVRAQVKVGVQSFEHHFGRRPKGMWLGECAYYPGVEEYMREEGIRFFFLDSHGILNATSRPKYGVYAPIYCPNGVAVFGRDWESSKQVWSAREGYPGDFCYRDFYRDVGFDLDYDYIKPYIHPDGIRTMTGIKYHKITGATVHKEPYDHDRAMDTAASHAGNFMFNREKQVEHIHGITGGKKLVIVSPYDAELFGHWWFEGPDWINFFLRKMAYDQKTVKTITPSEYLKLNPKNQMAQPSMSSWGNKGYAEVWLNGTNDWVYRHLHEMSFRMTELARKFPNPDDNLRRALNQAARELLLAQSSDWAFIMNSGTMVEYAVKRTKDHVYRFNKIYDGIMNLNLDMEFVGEMEWRDKIFPTIDYKVFA